MLRPRRRDILVAAPALLLPSEGKSFGLFPGGGRTFACQSGPSQPAPAASAGFNCLALWDDFTNVAATVDKNSTDAPGFLWYPGLSNRPGWNGTAWSVTGAISASNIIQQDPTTLRLKANTGVTSFQGITSSTLDPTNSYIVGQNFPNGCYVEARMRFDPTLVSNSVPWVAFVFSLVNGFQKNPSDVPFTELDLFEAFPTGGTGYDNHMAVVYWTKLDGTGSTAFVNTNDAVTISNNDGAFHTYGTLWQTMAQGGGTGSIRRYFDGSEITAAHVTYTSAGSPQSSQPNAFANLDGQANMLALDPGYGSWYSDWDYVQVWTL